MIRRFTRGATLVAAALCAACGRRLSNDDLRAALKAWTSATACASSSSEPTWSAGTSTSGEFNKESDQRKRSESIDPLMLKNSYCCGSKNFQFLLPAI